MALETETSLGVITFDDGEWDQSGVDSADDFTIIMWWMPTSNTAHQTRLFAARSAGGSSQFAAEYRDLGGEVDTFTFFRARATTNTTVGAGSSIFSASEWNFTAIVDHGSGGSSPQIFTGLQDSLAAEVSSYSVQTVGSGTPTSLVSNSIPLNLMGRRPNSTANAAAFRMASYGIYDRALSLAEVQALQFNPWALYGNCLFHCFLGERGASTGQIDHCSGNTNSTVNGTPTLIYESPAGVGRYPSIGNILPFPTAAASNIPAAVAYHHYSKNIG